MKNTETTIVVDNVNGFENLPSDTSNAIMIGNEVIEILPIDSKEGVLFTITDGKKAAVIRLRRNTP